MSLQEKRQSLSGEMQTLEAEAPERKLSLPTRFRRPPERLIIEELEVNIFSLEDQVKPLETEKPREVEK